MTGFDLSAEQRDAVFAAPTALLVVCAALLVANLSQTLFNPDVFIGIVFIKRVARRSPALFKHLIACGYSQEIPFGRGEVFLPETGKVAHAEAAHVVIFNNERLSVFNRIGEIVRIGKFGCYQFVR